MIRRVAAIVILTLLYGSAVVISKLARAIPRGRWKPTGHIAVIGTFLNPNWFVSHITPLSRCGVKEVILVADGPHSPLDRVGFKSPPRWLSRVLTRAGAKFLWVLVVGVRYKPDLYMGYHIFPGAVSALVVSRLFNRPACYQVTSGPLELEGGGWHAENRVLVALSRPSALVERMALAVTRQFELVVVRGNEARAFIRQAGYRGLLTIITGSVKSNDWRSFRDRSIDIIFIGRLTEYKRPDRFVRVMARVACRLPQVRAVMVGDGPMMNELQQSARELGVCERIEFAGQRKDVEEMLGRSKVFVLTSRWEGLSIAMIEAMAAGAVPVVSDVGDLRDLVHEGKNGHLVAEDQIDAYVDQVCRLLADESLWQQYSRAAVASAMDCAGVPAVSERWRQCLGEAVSAAVASQGCPA